jgi:hypothetical protein
LTFDDGRLARLRELHVVRRLWPFRRFIFSIKPKRASRLEPRQRPAPSVAAAPASSRKETVLSPEGRT